MRVRDLVLQAVILVAAASPALALALEIVDRDAARVVIDRQIAAFKRDDAAEAYSQASPTIRRMFPTQERFMELVREGYRPVYRHRRYSFGEARDGSDGGVEQPVDIQDEAGADWVAIYSLEKQPDGSWRISGCRLVKAPGQTA